MQVGRIHGEIVLGPRAQGRAYYAGAPVDWGEWQPTLHEDGSVTILVETKGGHATLARLLPLAVCGERRYAPAGQLVAATGCGPTEPGHQETGGRSSLVLEAPPDGATVCRLSAPARASIEAQLAALGLPPQRYVAPSTVHGRWKKRCHQGLVWAASGPF